MGIPDLPLELHKSIIDAVGEELHQTDMVGIGGDRELMKTLKTFAFVCRFWYTHTLSYIFRSVTIHWPCSPFTHSSCDHAPLLSLLDANPLIAKCVVRNVAFCVYSREPDDPPPPDTTLLDQLCGRLSHVAYLNIVCYDFGSDLFGINTTQPEVVVAIRRMTQNPHLRRLLLMGATLRSSFLRKAPNLNTLTLCRLEDVIIDDLLECDGDESRGPSLEKVLIKHHDVRNISLGSDAMIRLGVLAQRGVGLGNLFRQVRHIAHDHVQGQESIRWDPPIDSRSLESLTLCFELTDHAPNIHEVCSVLPWPFFVDLKQLDFTITLPRSYLLGDWIYRKEIPRFLMGASRLPHLQTIRVDVSFWNVSAHMKLSFFSAALIEVYRDGINSCFMGDGAFRSLISFHTLLYIPRWQLRDIPGLDLKAVGEMVAGNLPGIFTENLDACVLPGCKAYLELSWPAMVSESEQVWQAAVDEPIRDVPEFRRRIFYEGALPNASSFRSTSCHILTAKNQNPRLMLSPLRTLEFHKCIIAFVGDEASMLKFAPKTLADPRDLLRILSLVCKAWHTLTLAHTFRNLRIPSYSSNNRHRASAYMRLLRVLKANPSIGPLVKSVLLEVPPASKSDANLERISRVLTPVSSFTITTSGGAELDLRPLVLKTLHAFINTKQLRDLSIECPSLRTSLLAKIPNLKCLTLTKVRAIVVDHQGNGESAMKSRVTKLVLVSSRALMETMRQHPSIRSLFSNVTHFETDIDGSCSFRWTDILDWSKVTTLALDFSCYDSISNFYHFFPYMPWASLQNLQSFKIDVGFGLAELEQLGNERHPDFLILANASRLPRLRELQVDYVVTDKIRREKQLDRVVGALYGAFLNRSFKGSKTFPALEKFRTTVDLRGAGSDDIAGMDDIALEDLVADFFPAVFGPDGRYEKDDWDAEVIGKWDFDYDDDNCYSDGDEYGSRYW